MLQCQFFSGFHCTQDSQTTMRTSRKENLSTRDIKQAYLRGLKVGVPGGGNETLQEGKIEITKESGDSSANERCNFKCCNRTAT